MAITFHGDRFLYGYPAEKPIIEGLPKEEGKIKIKYRSKDFARAFWSDGKTARMFFLRQIKGNRYEAIECESNHHLT